MDSEFSTIYSLAIQLSPQRPGTIRATVGHQAHAAFLQAVKEADAALAEVLHHPMLEQRPFTVSPLLGVEAARDGLVAVWPEETYTLRFTVLHQPIFRQFMARFLHDDRPTLRLGQVSFAVKEILATPEASPWAGNTSFEALWHRAAGGPARISLEFSSPTAFSFGRKPWGRHVAVLPEPKLVLRSLARTWAAFAPSALTLDAQSVEQAAAENVTVQRLDRLETQMLHFGRYPQIGFVGRVTFQVMAPARSDDGAWWRQVFNALAEFAFYAGVGYKTTMGMGQCRRVSPLGPGSQECDDGCTVGDG